MRCQAATRPSAAIIWRFAGAGKQLASIFKIADAIDPPRFAGRLSANAP
jgi:hypothetical protein